MSLALILRQNNKFLPQLNFQAARAGYKFQEVGKVKNHPWMAFKSAYPENTRIYQEFQKHMLIESMKER